MHHSVTIEVTGHYEVEGGLVTVNYRGKSKATQLGGSPSETLARIMLRELVDEMAGRDQRAK